MNKTFILGIKVEGWGETLSEGKVWVEIPLYIPSPSIPSIPKLTEHRETGTEVVFSFLFLFSVWGISLIDPNLSRR